MSRGRVRRFVAAFDWKMMLATGFTFGMLVILLVGIDSTQQRAFDRERIAQQRESILAANNLIEQNTQTIARMDDERRASAKEAKRSRAKLERRILALTRAIEDAGLTVPAEDGPTQRRTEGAASPSVGPTSTSADSSPSGTAGSPQSSTSKPRASKPSSKPPSKPSGGSSGASGGSNGGASGGGSSPAPAPAPAPRPDRGVVGGITCGLLGLGC